MAIAQLRPMIVLCDGRFVVYEGAGVQRGGFSRVYAGMDTLLNEPVAVKLLDPLSEEYKWRPDRIGEELLILGKVRGPHIVQVLATQEILDAEGRRHFAIVMEMADMTLRAAIASGLLSPEECYRILVQLVIGIEYLHEHGVTHRDIKPENVLLKRTDRGLEVRITDFGLARYALLHRQQTSGVGTAGALAPELILKFMKEDDIRAVARDLPAFEALHRDLAMHGPEYKETVDWWALGVLAVELFSGGQWAFDCIPVTTGARLLTPSDCLRRIVACQAQPWAFLVPAAMQTSPALCEVVQWMLRWDPSSRPQRGQLRTHPLFAPYVAAPPSAITDAARIDALLAARRHVLDAVQVVTATPGPHPAAHLPTDADRLAADVAVASVMPSAALAACALAERLQHAQFHPAPPTPVVLSSVVDPHRPAPVLPSETRLTGTGYRTGLESLLHVADGMYRFIQQRPSQEQPVWAAAMFRLLHEYRTRPQFLGALDGVYTESIHLVYTGLEQDLLHMKERGGPLRPTDIDVALDRLARMTLTHLNRTLDQLAALMREPTDGAKNVSDCLKNVQGSLAVLVQVALVRHTPDAIETYRAAYTRAVGLLHGVDPGAWVPNGNHSMQA